MYIWVIMDVENLNTQLLSQLTIPTAGFEGGVAEPLPVYGVLLQNKTLMASTVKQGVPYTFYEVVRSFMPFTEIEWADILNVSTKSLQRFKQMNKIFKSNQSEKIMQMAEVTHHGLETFGDLGRFTQWLQTPNYALGNVTPKSMLANAYGKDLVMAEIHRINYGILS
ncbi:MAG: DUF2384 domain-containing protein [Bacteroidetes bacterium]|nr:MAG: DUF2384 domain-containing protein [Bacteroidota bacterium]